MFPNESAQTNTPTVYIHKGLQGRDDDYEILRGYFEQMQKMTVETSMDADIDLPTFALSAHWFGVIMVEGLNDQPECPAQVADDDCLQPEETGPELLRDLEDELDVCDLIMSAYCYRAEIFQELNIPRPITVEKFLTLPKEEKLRRWNEAWEDKRKDYTESAVEVRTPSPRGMPGGIYYLSEEDLDVDAGKGKMREKGVAAPWATSRPVDHPIPASVNRLINWPEDSQSDDATGPPSSNEDFCFVSETESPAPFGFSQFGFPGGLPPVDPNFGREYFEPDTEPPLKLPPIPDDPIVKKAMKEAANRKVDELRGQTVRLFEIKKARLARSRLLEARDRENGREKRLTAPVQRYFGPITKAKPIGLVYFTSSQNYWDPLHRGECNMGGYVAPEYRTLAHLPEALRRAIDEAFQDPDCHRLQAVMVDHPDSLDFLNLYTSA